MQHFCLQHSSRVRSGIGSNGTIVTVTSGKARRSVAPLIKEELPRLRILLLANAAQGEPA